MNGYDDQSLTPTIPPTRLRKLSRTWPIVGIVGATLITGAFINHNHALMFQGVTLMLAAIWTFTIWDLDDNDAWKDATAFVGLLIAVLLLGAGLFAWVGAV